MVKLVDKQNIFNSGILSSKLYSRDDLKQYNNGVADAYNFICSRYGPMEKRVGTEMAFPLDNPDEKVFFLPFVFSVSQSYLLEFLDKRIRFYTFQGHKIVTMADPDDHTVQYELETPFTADMLDKISYVQSLDVIYIAFSDGKTQPYRIWRYVDSNGSLRWNVGTFETVDGPYLDTNYDSTKKMKIADTETTTSTVSLINITLGSEDIGRWIRICTPRYNENTYAYEDKWSYGKIQSLGDFVWGLNRKTIYTATSSPSKDAQTYNNAIKTSKWGTISSVSGDGNTLTVYGRKFDRGSQTSSESYSWLERDRTLYVNDSEDINNQTIVYTKSDSISVNTQIYSDENVSVALAKATVAKINEQGKYLFRTADDTYYYVGKGKKIGSTQTHKWRRAKYVYTDSAYTNRIGTVNTQSTKDELLVQLFDGVTQSTDSVNTLVTITRTGSSIIVKWSYRNIVDDDIEQGGEAAEWMTDETSQWRLGVWHTGTSSSDYPVTYPRKVTIHQQRLVWAGLTDRPWVWMSNSFAYKNYAPSDYEGTISDTNSITYDISTDKVSDIFWIKSVKYLLVGTELGEIRMYSSGPSISPSDIAVNRESSYGAHNAEPIVNDDNIVFIQRLQRTIRALAYDDNKDSFVGPELTVLAESLTNGGIRKIVFQKEPNNTYWCLKEDGSLLTLTYDSAQDVIGWSRSQIAGKDVKIIDMAVLPSSDYQQDMLLLAVERVINGTKRRYLELLSKNFITDVEQKDSTFLDCSYRATFDEPVAYIEGLDYLEGETVRVMDEGSVLGDYVVTEGRIDFDREVSDIRIGLPYDAYIETLERDFQDKQLSTKMSKLRVYKLRMYLERTLGVSLYRLDRGSRTKLLTFDPSKNTDTTPELLTGKVSLDVPSAWDCDYRLRLESEPGLPCTLAGLIIGVEINEL